jgi:hypothetical protein
MKVTPRVNPSAFVPAGTLSTNGFTIGRAYEVVGMQGNCGVVVNDNGHERVVLLDGSPCAHIVSRYRNAHRWPVQNVVGYMEVSQ